MRHMAVIALGRLHVPVFEPFPQLSGTPHLIRRQACACRGPLRLQIAIDIQLARGLRGAREQVAQDLRIHRRSHHQRRAERMQVLGRQRRRRHQPPMRGLFDERVDEELGGALEQRIDGAEVGAIAGVFVALPERDREPRAAGRPHPPLRTIDRRRRAPEIRVVMRHPAARAVHRARRAAAGDREILHQRRQRIHRLLEVRGERGPVVHLGVDVDRVLASPRRRQAVVPDALEVGGLRPWPRAGDQEIARVLESTARRVQDRRRRRNRSRVDRSATPSQPTCRR